MKLSDQELSGLFIPCPSKLVTHHTSAQDTREQSRAYAGPGSAGDSSNSVGWEGGSVLLIGPQSWAHGAGTHGGFLAPYHATYLQHSP